MRLCGPGEPFSGVVEDGGGGGRVPPISRVNGKICFGEFVGIYNIYILTPQHLIRRVNVHENDIGLSFRYKDSRSLRIVLYGIIQNRGIAPSPDLSFLTGAYRTTGLESAPKMVYLTSINQWLSLPFGSASFYLASCVSYPQNLCASDSREHKNMPVIPVQG